MIVSKEIICPICKEKILLNIRDYQIDLNGCKNQHSIENVLLNQFENSQKIDLSKIVCDICRVNNKSNAYNHKFYFCNTCGKNLCPLCKSQHDKNHNIINYDDKNYICKKHNDKFIQFCRQCNMNLCFLCKNEHINHNIIKFENFIPNKEELLRGMEYMRQYINKFKNQIEEINYMFNKIINHLEIYYKEFNNIINNYNYNGRNFQNYYNLNQIKIGNNKINNDLINIIHENDINYKFQKIIDIYYKIKKTKKTKIYENGDKYIGELVNDLKNGKGKLYYSKTNNIDIDRYEGDFKNDQKEGKGILYFKNGDRYDGDFKNDKKEGKGILYSNNGDRYEGYFKNDKKNGEGILYLKNGGRYEGIWKDNKREGKIKVYYHNGDRYEGDIKDSKYEGKGIYFWKDGRRYEGDWKDNKKEGKGIIYYSTRDKYDRYEGDWKSDKLEGAGIIYYKNGDREMGDFLNGGKIGIHVKLNIRGDVTKENY